MSIGRRLMGAAALIAGLTLAARAVGFLRIVVFTWAVGNSDLGTVYQTANTIPNIIFELVAGGALASLVVPILAGPLSQTPQDRRSINDTTSALLTWAVLILTGLAIVTALCAEPIMRVLSADADPEMVATGARMLRIFAPQLPLYGVGVVLTGVLQAHQRFGWPALAPLLSSVAVICAYTIFAIVGPRGATIAEVSRAGELVLSIGTTAAVAVLSLCLLIPLRKLGVSARPTLRFTDLDAARRTRSLAWAGAVTVGAQQLALGLVIYLANPPAPEGALVIYVVAQAVYLLPWAILAVPVATSVYPTLATAHRADDQQTYAQTTAGALRSTLILTSLGAALLVAAAKPGAQLVARFTGHNPHPEALAAGIIGFAPGLIGYGIFALGSRALYARGANASAARVAVWGWAAAAAAALGLAKWLPTADRVFALAVGNSIGMVVLGAATIFALRRHAGPAAVGGAGRPAAAGLAAGLVSAFAGLGIHSWWGGTTPPLSINLVQGILAVAVTAAVFFGVLVIIDRNSAAPLVSALGRVSKRRPPTKPVSRPSAEPLSRLDAESQRRPVSDPPRDTKAAENRNDR